MCYGLLRPVGLQLTTYLPLKTCLLLNLCRLLNLCLLLTLCLTLASCASRISRSTLVFDYADFGPQAMAYRVIGPKNHQWDPQAPIPFGAEGVRVVVYRNIGLEEVQQQFPVDPERHQDYRYLAYADAMNYLEARIRQNLLKRITLRLERTRDSIRNHLD